MRNVLLCTGVLGGGAALVIALAVLVTTALPATAVGGGWSVSLPMRGAVAAPVAIPEPVDVDAAGGARTGLDATP